jgi:uncharacterized protein YndB with AHSA1/START domain
MPPIVSTIDIDRPPAEVFAFVTDPARFPQWQKDVMRVDVSGDGRFTTTRRIGRTERTMTQVVTDDSPPHTWSARGVDGPIRPAASVTVEPAGTGSRVTFSLDFEGRGIGVPLLPLVRRQARLGAPVSYRNVKRLLEASHQA